MGKRIGFMRRMGALLIDCALLAALAGLLGPRLGALRDGPAAGVLRELSRLLFGAPALGALYFLSEGLTGYTPGKLLLGLRIGTAAMTPAPVPVLLVRFCCKHPHYLLGALGLFTSGAVATFGALLGMVAFLGCFAAIGEKRQALHDLIAGTAVYPRAALAPAVAAP